MSEAMPGRFTDEHHHMETPVRRFMSPGVISIAEDASLSQVYSVMTTHGVHAVLVIGHASGRPIGWVTARGLLAWVEADDSMAYARDAITEAAARIEPGATAREALVKLSQPGTTHLVVSHREDWPPEGVVTELDIIRLARGRFETPDASWSRPRGGPQ